MIADDRLGGDDSPEASVSQLERSIDLVEDIGVASDRKDLTEVVPLRGSGR